MAYQTEWDLKKHFYESQDDPRIKETIDEDLAKIDAFVTKYDIEGKVSSLNDEDFLTFINEKVLLFKGLINVYHYFSYLNTLDTQDQSVLKEMGLLGNIWSDQSKKLTFMSKEYKDIGYDKLMERSENPLFAELKNSLVNSANNLKHILSQETENSLIEVGNVTEIFTDIYTELTNSFTFEIDGEVKNKSEIYAMRISQDSETRRKANEALYNKYQEHQIVLGGIYKSVCKDNVSDIKMRGYDDVMTTRNMSEQMDKDVVDKLLAKVKGAYPIYHKFLGIKAKMLGHEGKMPLSDVLAPIPNEKESKITFEKGLEFYLDKIKSFDEDFYEYSKEMFEDGRVTVYPSQNKRDGAYASYSKGEKSFVMLNHTDDLNSVMTLTHELGHAIHGSLEQGQHESVYRSPLSLAETASIFNETLVFGDVLDNVSEEERTYYTMEKLNDTFSTMFRQVMYIDFERECHTRFLNGEELTYEDFNQIWLDKSREIYGDNVEVWEESKCGWSVIPHIFQSPFYCYSYSFGNILSFNLYDMYQKAEDKEEFKVIYKNILKSGGSKRPKDLLNECGIDITSDEFYDGAFNVVEDYIKQVEESHVSV
jgi:oligoendopeptidase F